MKFTKVSPLEFRLNVNFLKQNGRRKCVPRRSLSTRAWSMRSEQTRFVSLLQAGDDTEFPSDPLYKDTSSKLKGRLRFPPPRTRTQENGPTCLHPGFCFLSGSDVYVSHQLVVFTSVWEIMFINRKWRDNERKDLLLIDQYRMISLSIPKVFVKSLF